MVYASDDAIRLYSEALALSAPDDPARFDLLRARAAVYDVVARRAEQRADVDAMLAIAEREDDDARRCDALLALADLCLETDSARSREPAERAVEIARRMGDRVREGHALRRLGWGAWLRVGHLESRSSLEAAVERFREAGLPGEAATCLHMLSIALVQLGDYAEALRTAREAVDLSRVAGDRRQEAIALRRTAIALVSLYRMEEALPQAEAALALHRALGDRTEETNALHVLGNIYTWLRRPEAAYTALRQSHDLAEAIGSGPSLALVVNSLITDHYRPRGEFEGGLAFLETRLADPHLGANEMVRGFAQWLKSLVLLDLGQFSHALETIQQVLPSAENLWGYGFQVSVLCCAGRAYAELGRCAQARDHLATALSLAENAGARLGAGLALCTLAYTALLEGRPTGLRSGLRQAGQAVQNLTGSNIDWVDALADSLHIQARLRLALAETEGPAAHQPAALQCSERLMTLALENPVRVPPAQFYYTHSQCLRAAGREREADDYLRRAAEWVYEVAGKTRAESLRRGWLETVRLNRATLTALAARGLRV
jgi:tetratricopeptide (TPR) repeat protein